MSVLKSAVLAGIVLFLWGAFSWMVLPWHSKTLKEFGEPALVQGILEAGASGAGVYIVPGFDQRPAGDAAEKSFAFVVFHPDGAVPMQASLWKSFAVQTAAAFLVSLLVYMADIRTYAQRVFFVVLVAAAAGVMCYLPPWVWWRYPSGYTLVHILDLAAGWLLAGLVIARFVKRNRPAVGFQI